MQGADLSQPQRFVMADTVTKNSKTGITANKRLLVIKKGYLFYYSNVPKNFKNDIKFLQSYQQLPKCSIEILNIKKINGFQQNSNYFSIQFEARHMMEREDIRKTMTLEQFNFAPKNKKQTITWQFTCDNQFIKQKWVHTLQTLHAHYSKEKINIQKFFDNINKKEDEQISKPIRSSLMVPWREDQIKKSSSNESLTKIRASQMSMNRSPSPSNGKKSGNSNNSEKNQPKQVNQIKLFSPPNEEQDLVETFMKIEKTKSAHEPVTTAVIQEVIQIPETPRVQHDANFDNNEDKFLGTPEIKQQQQNPRLITSFTKKQSPEIKQQQEDQKLEEPQQLLPQPRNHDKKIAQPQTLQLIKEIPAQLPKLNKLFSQPIPTTIQDQSRNKSHHINQSASLRKKQSIQYNLNVSSNFYEIIYFASNRQYTFDKRIEAQKKFNAFVGHFNDRAVKGMVEFVTEKANGRSSGRFNQDKIGDALAILDVGLLKYKIAYVNTQAITINGKQKIFYNQASVKSIKKQMKIYNKMLTIISNNLKLSLGVSTPKSSLQLQLSFSLSRSRATPEPSLSTSEVKSSVSSPSQFANCLLQLRVPLCTYIEYKGISAIVFDQSLKGKEVQIVDKDKVSQWKQVMRVLGFNPQCFQFRSVSSQVGELVVAYITSTNQIQQKKEKKHHNINFCSPLNTEFLKLCQKQQASTSIESLSTYLKSIDKISPDQFSCPKNEIKTLLEYCYLCKYLRKFYRAAQAQIDQLNFINLLLKGDQNINRLFKSSGFDLLPSGSGGGSDGKMVGVSGVFFQFLLYYLGIYCVVDVRKLVQFGRIRVIGVGVDAEGSQKCVVSVKIMPRVIGYSLQCLQIYELVQKAEVYLSQNNKQLATTSLQHKQQCYFENPHQTSTYPYPSTLSMLLSQAQLNYIQNDYITCIGKCKQYLQLSKLSNDPDQQHEDNDEEREDKESGKQRGRYLMGSGCIPVYMLLVKCYSKFSKDKFVESIRNMMTCAIDNFGEYSSVVVTLFEFIGLVYSANGDYTQAQAYLRVAIKVGQKVYEGISQAKLAQLYLDLSRVLIYMGKNEQSNQYSTNASQIIQLSGSPAQKTHLLLFTLQSHIKLPQSIETQQKCIQELHKLQKYLSQTTKIGSSISVSVLKQYFSMMYQVGIKYEKKELCLKSISGLWKLDIHSKIIAVQYAFRLVAGKFSEGKRAWGSVLDRWTLSKEKSVLVVEKGLASYSNIVDMIQEVLTEEDPELLPAIIKLLPAEVIRQL